MRYTGQILGIVHKPVFIILINQLCHNIVEMLVLNFRKSAKLSRY